MDDSLCEKIEIVFEDKNFESVKSIYSDFESRYPESIEFNEAKSVYDKEFVNPLRN